ncbi:flagellar protein FlaG [Clostridium omnivorum]|uniref:Flagellar protein FlaG n=1 Tax=Clostridium omnivorum TaxID=1604902 RepID=A0ABQ5NAV3_9CLOT|nr:flagellar protein FlaG [Clostridium sp. E14]GLC32327.1 hypothetical protein bsdE14_37370 [Clostridium sp. E14]
MELRNIGQGGQVNSETVKNIDKSNSYNSTDVKYQDVNDKSGKDLVVTSMDKDTDEKAIKKAVDKLNKFLEDDKTHAEYEVHDKFRDIMIKIVDDKTGKVIQEFPPKKILDMVAKMCEMVGVLFDKKA